MIPQFAPPAEVFAGYTLSLDIIAMGISALLPVKIDLVLSLDHINRKLGEININIFMLGMTYKGVAFPLLFTMLDKRGNSNNNKLNFFFMKHKKDKVQIKAPGSLHGNFGNIPLGLMRQRI